VRESDRFPNWFVCIAQQPEKNSKKEHHGIDKLHHQGGGGEYRAENVWSTGYEETRIMKSI